MLCYRTPLSISHVYDTCVVQATELLLIQYYT